MNLSDARVDLDGGIVALGQFRCATNDKGDLTLSPHNGVRFGIDAWGRLRLGAVNAVRDPASGFLMTSEVGVAVLVPDCLSSIIRSALRRPPSRSLNALYSEQEEGLRWNSGSGPKDDVRTEGVPFLDPDSWKRQLLSDWKLEVCTEREDVKIRISAALFATEPVRVYEKAYFGHWSVANNTPPRIEIEFSVDLATRVAAFHAAYITSEACVAVDSDRPFNTTLTSLNLASAPINTSGEIFGTMGNGRWVSVGTDHDSLLITPHYSKKRSVNGFLLCDTGHNTPSIALRGIAMTTLLRGLWRASRHTATLEWRNGTFGFLIQDRGFHERYEKTPRQFIQHVVIECRVGMKGLELAYRLYIADLDVSQSDYKAAWLEDMLTIPWEVVILRYPELLWHRAALLNDSEPV